MEWLAALGGVLSALLGLLLWRSSTKAAEATANLEAATAELKGERESTADLRLVAASKEKVIRDLETRIAEVDPSPLFDDVFGVSDQD